MRLAGLALVVSCLLIFGNCAVARSPTLQPAQASATSPITLAKGQLRAVFADNQAFGQHRAGYNGIAELYHPAQGGSPFVPALAGFNLEHIFGGDVLEQLFEPRRHAMTLHRVGDDEVLLYQSSTPLSQVESLTSFKLVEPHYIDVTFRCIFRSKDFFRHNYAGLFWASYIDRPADRRIHFRGVQKQGDRERWIAAFSPKHGVESTHRGTSDTHDFYFASDFNATLANHFSAYRYMRPYYYGLFHNMLMLFLFDSPDVIRFSQSPTGGGGLNPAWDFQVLITNPRLDQPYGFRTRVVYKPFVSQEDVDAEYRRWRQTLH
jgi:hypothetical protein